MTSEAQPLMGRITALDTRYEVRTQVLSSVPADRLPAMCGSATLAMLVSSTSMNVAIVTVRAIAQGLCRGRHSACVATAANSLTSRFCVVVPIMTTEVPQLI